MSANFHTAYIFMLQKSTDILFIMFRPLNFPYVLLFQSSVFRSKVLFQLSLSFLPTQDLHARYSQHHHSQPHKDLTQSYLSLIHI